MELAYLVNITNYSLFCVVIFIGHLSCYLFLEYAFYGSGKQFFLFDSLNI